MTLAELAHLDATVKRQNLANALREERRGLAIRAGQAARTDAIEKNIARLERELQTLPH